MEGYGTLRRPCLIFFLMMCCLAMAWQREMSMMLLSLFFILLLVFYQKWHWLLLLFVVRLMLLPCPRPGWIEGEAMVVRSLEKESEVILQMQGQRYIMKKAMPSGYYHMRLKRIPFSRHIKGLSSEREHYQRRGLMAEVQLEWSKPSQLAVPWKERILRWLFERSKAFGSQAHLARALLLGAKGDMDYLFRQKLAGMGLLHLFVVSGLHYQIMMKGMKRFFRLVKLPRMLSSLLLLAFFSILSWLMDFHASSLRCLLLFLLREIHFYRKSQGDPQEELFMAGILMIAFRPALVSGLGFYFGMMAHLALVYAKDRALPRLYLCLLPLQLTRQALISPFFILLNLILVKLMEGLLPILFLGFILAPLGRLAEILMSGMEYSIAWVAMIPWLKFMVFYPSTPLLFLFYGGLILQLMQWQNLLLHRLFLKRKKELLFIAILLGALILWREESRLPGVYFLDIGQGDATLVFSSRGKTMLIDTGKSLVIHEELRKLRIFHVDVLIVTHPDLDHVGMKDAISWGKGYTSLHTPIPGLLPLKRGDCLQMDDISLEVLDPTGYAKSNNNDNSLVMRLELGDMRVLLPGDISGRYFRREWLAGVDVFHFSHHGSLHSLDEEKMRDCRAPYLILSYGKNNYGHPAPQVKEFFRDRIKVIHETMIHGTLRLGRP